MKPYTKVKIWNQTFQLILKIYIHSYYIFLLRYINELYGSICNVSINKKNNIKHTGHIKAKANNGPVERANNHCHPKVGIITSARNTSKHAPNAQKHYKTKTIFHKTKNKNNEIYKLTSSKTTHLALCLVGKNSAYKVTLW